MQKVKLPYQVEPVKSALKRSDYEGVMAASDMERLTGSVVSSSEWVNVKVQFEKDAQGLTVFHGSLEVEVSLICQRCNETFDCPLYVEFCYSPVQGQQDADAEALPDAYEPVEVGDHGEVNLLQLFEDELILALPIVPFHAEGACTVTSDDMQFGEIEPEQEQTNPFAVLKELKRDQE
ncbi:23S rRNA accumulation protein YceD [Alteromonas gilva]|uniref:Large ribosomal RNA subunit accumulation protein YceD n=1 Tax=Alteromonas gilva TaxID=2987522 RepID=A0ABT5L2J7_9ALTE|nr:23S rRNA accumulation protein YceD [Alteromonas gilva]MDC8831274.1 23S rRNA accumulation protein YceD [Alteromonas gilva]